jgi:hypothetical protein
LCEKITVSIEKSPVTSSNCYKTIKTASVLIKLGTNDDWIIAFVKTCSNLISCFNGSKGTSQKSAANSQWIEIESNPYKRYLMTDLG